MAESASKKVGEDDSFNTLLESYRKKLNAGDILLHEILSKEDLYLSLENMSPLSHIGSLQRLRQKDLILDFLWPVFLTYQNNEHDGEEITESVWITPEMALEKASSGEMQMIMPTLKNLRKLLWI